MRLKVVWTVILLLALFATPFGSASIGRGHTGKYSGVVICDRWGGCLLFSGGYITYISEKMTEMGKANDGQAIELDAKKVSHPPDDLVAARLDEFEVLGPAQNSAPWPALDTLKLVAHASWTHSGKPSVEIEVYNGGLSKIALNRDDLTILLLARVRGPDLMNPTDGPSYAVLCNHLTGGGASGLRIEGEFKEPRTPLYRPSDFPSPLTCGQVAGTDCPSRFGSRQASMSFFLATETTPSCRGRSSAIALISMSMSTASRPCPKSIRGEYFRTAIPCKAHLLDV